MLPKFKLSITSSKAILFTFVIIFPFILLSAYKDNKTFCSSIPVNDAKDSASVMPSSISKSLSVPSPFIIIASGINSDNSSQRFKSFSIIVTLIPYFNKFSAK